ncbi:MAG TPA: beta-galactosidase [Tepidisphaeraceae bacterium]|nr:beta-galactosidase [Tepidisphaeraceae bacterium]
MNSSCRGIVRKSFGILSITLAFILSLSANALAAPSSEGSSTDALSARLKNIQARLPELKHRLDDLKSKGQDISYPLVTDTVLENFTAYALEELGIRTPGGWGMIAVNGAQATAQVVKDAHSGQWAIAIVNHTPRQPNVYGMFECHDVISLQAGKPYTLSVWSKGEKPGVASVTINAPWTERLPIDATGDVWRRFSKTFTPTRGDTAFKPRVIVEDVGTGFVIDDICLVSGAEAELGTNLLPNPSFEESWNQERVSREIGDMEAMADRLKAQLDAAQGGKLVFPIVPRWDGSARPTIEGPSFMGPVRIGSHSASLRRPIFFVGYGHFDQVRNDIEKFPGYGVNIVQNGELGPSAIYPKEGQTDDAAIEQLSAELDRAAKAGVAVDWLLSPHYTPAWIFTKYPALRKARADFFPYSVYAPQMHNLLREFIHHVVARIKDKPALLSICLSNEPINCEEPDATSTALWRAWLKARHGSIATLNARWKTSYASFDQIPQPNPLGASGEPRPGGAWCDFCRWNDEYFTQFHKIMADAVHDVAPQIPVHIKATTPHYYQSGQVRSGDDADLFGRITQINGNDSINLWSFGERAGSSIERGDRDFAQGWRENALPYELQRSVHDAPVFNSENHLIFDREARYVSPAHVRAALWMGAIHGQSATTIWVWERELSNPQGDFAGDFIERPGCAEAVGIVCHDLNRVAPQITALQNAQPQVRILQSNTASVWDGGRYDAALLNLFTALSFTGRKVGFVSETQLERKAGPDAAILFVPDIQHLSDAAFESLKNFKGKIIFASTSNSSLLTRNEYDQPRAAQLPAALLSDPIRLPATWQVLLPMLRSRLKDADVSPMLEVVNAEGSPQAQVQWQTAQTPDGLVVNLYNARHDPATVMVTPPTVMTDLLSGEKFPPGARITLKSLDVSLFAAERGG